VRANSPDRKTRAVNSIRWGINNSQIGKNVEKLSSGFRVNREGDDILFQASTAMLAQANAIPQSVLQLVG